MRVIFAIALVVHGLIHALGAAKAFKLAALPQLTQPISAAMGLLWLIAAVLFLGTAVAHMAGTRSWWAIGAVAIVISQGAITASWTDAKFGSLLNLVALVGVVLGFLAQGPWSLRARYDADLDAGVAHAAAVMPVTEADLAHLPASVRRHLLASGVVGQPRIQNMRVQMHGRIRSGPTTPWMPFTAEQHNFYDRPSRFVTNAGRAIRADLIFNDAGELTDFWSDDRRQASADGRTMRAVRWSTPLGDYRAFGPIRLGSRGEALWHEPAGAYAYIQIEVDDVRYNVAGR